MSETVTPEVSDTIVRHARAVATQTQRPLEAVLLEWLDRSAAEVPVELLPDDEVLALRDQMLSQADQSYLSELLFASARGRAQR